MINEDIAAEVLDLSQRVGALKYGEFILSSGMKSNYYFDGRLISLHPEGSVLLGKLFFEQIKEQKVDAVGGPAVASIPIATAVALTSQLEGQPVKAFFVRPAAKGHGTGQQIEGDLKPGDRIMIVDDVCTSGNSLFLAIEAAESIGCEVIKVAVLLDRKQGGSEEVRRKGYDFQSVLEPDQNGVVKATTQK